MGHENEEFHYGEHKGIVGRQNVAEATTRKVLCARIWWPSLFQEAKEYCKQYDVY